MATQETSETPPVGPVRLQAAFERLAFLPDRTPSTERDDYFTTLAPYRDGAIFAAHYAGASEWERHTAGEEIVLVLEGCTTIVLRIDGADRRCPLAHHELVVVPQGVWHRFETPRGVKVISVTPQPTDHRVDDPACHDLSH